MDHRAGFHDAAGHFLEVAASADRGARVPACPEWDVADLVFHLGRLWWRFERIVAGRLTERDQVREVGEPERPAAADVVAWAGDQLDRFEDALASLEDDEPVWNFSRTPQVGAWYPRRMHHEAVVHGFDLESAVGEPAAIDADVAHDGVDELMTVLSTAGRRWPDDAPTVTLQVATSAPDGRWAVRLEPGQRGVVVGQDGLADVTVGGGAEAVLLAAWARRPLDTVAVTGDTDVAKAALAAIAR